MEVKRLLPDENRFLGSTLAIAVGILYSRRQYQPVADGGNPARIPCDQYRFGALAYRKEATPTLEKNGFGS